MYGLVNKAIEDLAISVGGEDVWNKIKEEAGIEVLGFVSMDAYPDEMTYALVGAASKVLETPAEDILRAFGRHWVLYTARQGWGPLLNSAGNSIAEFLGNLDALHARVGLTMPNLRPPSFEVDTVGDGTYVVRYYSEREGLAPMVVGLLEGVGERFGYKVEVTHRGRPRRGLRRVLRRGSRHLDGVGAGGSQRMTVAMNALVREAAARLNAAGVPNAEEEARTIADAAMTAVPDDESGEAVVTAQFVDLVRRRSERVPLQRLLGSVRFRNIELLVGHGVFVPQPETGPVVEWCVEAMRREGARAPRVIDLGTGSGVVALSLANELVDAEVHAVEIDPAAFAWTTRNADARAKAGDTPVVLHLSDMAALPSELDETFDLVASNPPYVADHEIAKVDPEVRDHDPRRAIHGGADGLDLVRAVELAASRLVKPGGLVVVEHSDRQGRSAPAVFAKTGRWIEIEDHVDQEGRDRFVTARRPRADGERPNVTRGGAAARRRGASPAHKSEAR